jgi:hypothetical protein
VSWHCPKSLIAFCAKLFKHGTYQKELP